MKLKAYDEMILTYTFEASREKAVADTGAWVSYTTIVGKEGLANVKIMLDAGTIQTRPHPKIPEGMIPWPENLQFKYEELAI